MAQSESPNEGKQTQKEKSEKAISDAFMRQVEANKENYDIAKQYLDVLKELKDNDDESAKAIYENTEARKKYNDVFWL